jgi:hypothetical protein
MIKRPTSPLVYDAHLIHKQDLVLSPNINDDRSVMDDACFRSRCDLDLGDDTVPTRNRRNDVKFRIKKSLSALVGVFIKRAKSTGETSRPAD